MKNTMFQLLVATTFFSSILMAQTPSLQNKANVKTSSPAVKKESPSTDSKDHEALELEPEKVEYQFLNSLDYPELQVVPRASERLAMDGAHEADDGYMMFWPFHVASGTTMIVALMNKNRFNPDKEGDESFRKYADFKVNAAAGLSAAWFAFTYFVSASEPYNSTLTKFNSIKGKDKKSQLLKERMAEEAMQKPAELVNMMAYLSTATNLIAAGGLIDIVNEDYNLYAGVAMLTAFMPLIFRNKYIVNYEKQMEYKRKIYAPVVYTDFYKPNQWAQWSPRLVMQWNF